MSNPRSQIQNSKLGKSFTLIEIIIVIAIIGLVIPAVFSIIFVILNQQIKIYRLQQVKKEGDFVISSIENTIKNNTQSIYQEQALTSEKCGVSEAAYPVEYSDPGGVNFYFKDKINKWFNYSLEGGKVSSSSADIGMIDLTTDKVTVSNFDISCARNSIYSPATISLSLTIAYQTSSTRVEETAVMTYNTKINLKSY